jgi:hypothetical protein
MISYKILKDLFLTTIIFFLLTIKKKKKVFKFFPSFTVKLRIKKKINNNKEIKFQNQRRNKPHP